MSHYTKITNIDFKVPNEKALVSALQEHFGSSYVKTSPEGSLKMKGADAGETRPTVHIRVDQAAPGLRYNDTGFLRRGEGYDIYTDNMADCGLTGDTLARVKQKYVANVVAAQYEEMGLYGVTSTTDNQGNIVLLGETL